MLILQIMLVVIVVGIFLFLVTFFTMVVLDIVEEILRVD